MLFRRLYISNCNLFQNILLLTKIICPNEQSFAFLFQLILPRKRASSAVRPAQNRNCSNLKKQINRNLQCTDTSNGTQSQHKQLLENPTSASLSLLLNPVVCLITSSRRFPKHNIPQKGPEACAPAYIVELNQSAVCPEIYGFSKKK